MYAGLATALSSGLGYVHPNLPSLPGAVHYPPLYPLVLAPFFGILQVNAAAIAGKVLNALLSAVATGLLTWHAIRTAFLGPTTPRWVSGAIVFAAAVAIPVLATQGVLFAEPLFGVLLVVAIIATDAAASSGREAWIAGIAVALALLTRSIAIAVLAGVCCFLLLRRAPRRVIVIVAVPGIVAALLWSLWVAIHARQIDPELALGYGTYFAHISQAGLSAVSGNVRDMSRPLEALVFGWLPWAWLYVVLATVSLGIGLYGLWLALQRSPIGISLVFYFIILAIWPYPPDRFIWAVLPWLALIWAAAMFDFWRRWTARPARITIALLGALVAGGYLLYQYRGFRGRWWDTEARSISANFAELLPVVANLPDSAVVATDDEALVWLYTRRRAVPLYLESYHGRELIRPTPAEHRAYLERMHVTHILLASATSPSAIELRALLGAYPSSLTGIYRWSDGRWLFSVNRGQ
ncbi:MAG TPA: hypothetical protein VKQ05_08525 [Gemmatimonadales bacterium]|nr:hypothetical protein [Gemmatimonadales bacterium]